LTFRENHDLISSFTVFVEEPLVTGEINMKRLSILQTVHTVAKRFALRIRARLIGCADPRQMPRFIFINQNSFQGGSNFLLFLLEKSFMK